MFKQYRATLRSLLKKNGVTYKELDRVLREYATTEINRQRMDNEKLTKIENRLLKKALDSIDYAHDGKGGVIKLQSKKNIEKALGLRGDNA